MVIALSLMDHLNRDNLGAPTLIEPGCDLDLLAHLTTDTLVEMDRCLGRPHHRQPGEDA